ncbi:extracellular solute-binding protein [Propioniciclava coleopterorum]|uniref:Extracellular solute-binding protein n=1 Tax=Propioniciclava coleopterorum TaxID=2714937 RepID=A0A6G7Y8N7_9ACTN|nr:extracellular solute-binding protein [Propioniciclava coleopterorum]QIK73182.1 extracellular solute-binding protein [Propioniciclava coleopterorum]
MTPNKFGKRGIKAAALAAAAAMALTACGTGGNDGATTLGTAENPITWMAGLHTANTPDPNGPIMAKLEELTGTQFDMQWYPDASKEEKVNAALASGSMADIVSLSMINSTSVRGAMTSGVFWEVEEYLKDYPNLSKIPAATIESGKIDGKLYGVPFVKPGARYGVLVRQDWLDKLGLEAPHTIEELGKVAEAFTTQDPDGNGKNDTVGFYDRQESFLVGFRSLAGYFGAGQRFQVTPDEKVVPAFASDEFKQAMEWYRGMFTKGAVNQEFITVQKKNQQDGLARGKGGIAVTGLFEAKNYLSLAQSADPNTPMKWALINDITFEDVPRRILTDTNGGMGGWMAIPKSEVKTEAELKIVLNFLDKLSSEDGFKLMTNGIEGTHYTVDGSGVVKISDQALWEQQVQPYGSSRPNENVMTFKSAAPYVDEANELMKDNEQYVVTDPSLSLTSPTADAQWSMIEQKANDAYNRYMSGQLDMAGYEAAIKALDGQGLSEIVKEYTEAYAKAKKA